MDPPAHTCCHASTKQCGHVRETQQPPWPPSKRLFQKPGSAPASASTGQEGGMGNRLEITPTLVVPSGQIAPAPLADDIRTDPQSPAAQDRDPSQKVFSVVQSRACSHNCHLITTLQRRKHQLRPLCVVHQPSRPRTRPNNNNAPKRTW